MNEAIKRLIGLGDVKIKPKSKIKSEPKTKPAEKRCKDCNGPGPFRDRSHQCKICHRAYLRNYMKTNRRYIFVVSGRLVVGPKTTKGIRLGLADITIPVGDLCQVRGFKLR